MYRGIIFLTFDFTLIPLVFISVNDLSSYNLRLPKSILR